MKNKNIFIITILFSIFFGIGLGVIYNKYEIFPYKQLRNFYHFFKNPNTPQKEINSKEQSGFYDLWSIGVYEGQNPFELAAADGVDNPIISSEDVTDIDASYVADPFMVFKDNIYYVFFETYNWETKQGDIAYAISKDGIKWEYQKVVLDEKFHLSYPYILKWQNDYYMIPESNEDLAVRIYKAKSFPEQWEYIGNIISGYHFIDPSVVYYNNMWWLFVASVPDDGVVNLYYSDNLFSGWQAHPMNPIVRLDKHFARPAGRLLVYNDRLYRLAQDGYIEYGQQVFAFEVKNLSNTDYNEQIVSKSPIISRSGDGWNAAGMHHLDIQYINGKWFGVADGKLYSEIKKNSLNKIH